MKKLIKIFSWIIVSLLLMIIILTVIAKLAEKYNDNLNYYVNQKASEQNDNIYEIVKNLERYRSLIQVVKSKEDTVFYEKNRKIFNSYNKRFERFRGDNE